MGFGKSLRCAFFIVLFSCVCVCVCVSKADQVNGQENVLFICYFFFFLMTIVFYFGGRGIDFVCVCV